MTTLEIARVLHEIECVGMGLALHNAGDDGQACTWVAAALREAGYVIARDEIFTELGNSAHDGGSLGVLDEAVTR